MGTTFMNQDFTSIGTAVLIQQIPLPGPACPMVFFQCLFSLLKDTQNPEELWALFPHVPQSFLKRGTNWRSGYMPKEAHIYMSCHDLEQSLGCSGTCQLETAPRA